MNLFQAVQNVFPTGPLGVIQSSILRIIITGSELLITVSGY